MTKNEKSLDLLPEYLKTVPDGTKLYIGCDSERNCRKGEWYADYCIVVVVHIAGNKGCKIFGDIIRERDYTKKLDKPSLRLMTEAYKVAEFFINNYEYIEPFDYEIHLDINPKEEAGSNCVINEASGYIKNACGVTPKVKPEAFSASYAADRFAYILANTTKKKGKRRRRKADKKLRKAY